MAEMELTPQVRRWLDTPAASRSLAEGADLLLRITRNQILYANLTRNLARSAEAIEYHLEKIYKSRMIAATHEQVAEMSVKVKRISAELRLDLPPDTPTLRTEIQRGKRADHDELPEEIRRLYTDNLAIIRRMRECHVHMRLISSDNSTCPDSDRYPWVKEIIALDRQYRENWNIYDHYIKGTPAAAARPVLSAHTQARNSEKTCHLLLGQYAKRPTPELADRIKAAFASIGSPSARLHTKMIAAGLC